MILDIAFTLGEIVFVAMFAVVVAIGQHRPMSNSEKTVGIVAFWCAVLGPVIRHHFG